MKRPRGPGGRFLSKEEREQLEQEGKLPQYEEPEDRPQTPDSPVAHNPINIAPARPGMMSMQSLYQFNAHPQLLANMTRYPQTIPQSASSQNHEKVSEHKSEESLHARESEKKRTHELSNNTMTTMNVRSTSDTQKTNAPTLAGISQSDAHQKRQRVDESVSPPLFPLPITEKARTIALIILLLVF